MPIFAIVILLVFRYDFIEIFSYSLSNILMHFNISFCQRVIIAKQLFPKKNIKWMGKYLWN